MNKQYSYKIGTKLHHLHIHNLEQIDIETFPLFCIHRRKPNESKRVFCIYKKSGQIIIRIYAGGNK